MFHACGNRSAITHSRTIVCVSYGVENLLAHRRRGTTHKGCTGQKIMLRRKDDRTEQECLPTIVGKNPEKIRSPCFCAGIQKTSSSFHSSRLLKSARVRILQSREESSAKRHDIDSRQLKLFSIRTITINNQVSDKWPRF